MFIKSLARQTVLLQLLLHSKRRFASSFSRVDIASAFVRRRTLAERITTIMRFLCARSTRATFLERDDVRIAIIQPARS